jgi:hypothetical protein
VLRNEHLPAAVERDVVATLGPGGASRSLHAPTRGRGRVLHRAGRR